MASTKFKLNKKGVRTEILQADWMLKHIKEVANEHVGSDRRVKAFIGVTRAKAIMYKNRRGTNK